MGFPVARWCWTESPEDAIRFFKKIRKPVVLKAISKDIIHKFDVGAVKLNLDSEDKIEEAFRELKRKFKDAKILVQEMIDGIEVFLGAKKDPIFGWVISFGIGGIFVEIYEDISMRVAPIDKKEALEMMREIKGRKILEGYRGKRINKQKLADLISKFSKNLEKIEGKEIDLNPIICNKKGCWIVDFRVIK